MHIKLYNIYGDFKLNFASVAPVVGLENLKTQNQYIVRPLSTKELRASCQIYQYNAYEYHDMTVSHSIQYETVEFMVIYVNSITFIKFWHFLSYI